MWSAYELHKKVGFLVNSQLNQIIDQSVKRVIDDTKDDPIKHILYSYADKNKSYNSTTSLRYNLTSGFTSLKRVVSGNTI